MASPFQQPSVQRKLVYFALIVVLFTSTLLLRGSMKSQAQDLDLRDQDLGRENEAALDSAAYRLILFGARGPLICYLWYDAHEKQKTHEWNLLDQRIRLIVKLQPHFITPWLHQSWNLAYNVSVEFDRIRDKYFYIARGVELLAEGERQNKGNAEMRFYIANTQQGKMGISDENNTLRSLYQMSCIDPRDRNPAVFRTGSDMNWPEFEDFCRKHPHLVRRLREKLNYRTPDDIIDFLAANYQIPSRYEYDLPGTPVRLKPLAERFPILPPKSNFGDRLYEDARESTDLTDDKDNYAVARAWYAYAQDPLDDKELNRKRKVKYGMAEAIFRGYPARSQCFIAERRAQEGWFDPEPKRPEPRDEKERLQQEREDWIYEGGWRINDWFPQSFSDPEGPKGSATVGSGTRWAGEAWEITHDMYEEHGQKNGLHRTREQVTDMSADLLKDYQHNKHITNFDHFFYKSKAEQTPEAIAARKRFHYAAELQKQAEVIESLKLYEMKEALGPPETWSKDKATGWKRVLMDHPEFRQDMDTQEETYTIQMDYLRAFYKVRDRLQALRAAVLMRDTLALVTANPALAALRAGQHLQSPLPPPPIKAPFDDVDADGKPFVSADAVDSALSRKALTLPYLGAGAKPARPEPPPAPAR